MIRHLVSTHRGTHLILEVSRRFAAVGSIPPQEGRPGCATVTIAYAIEDLPCVRAVWGVMREQGRKPRVVLTGRTLQVSCSLTDVTPPILERILGAPVLGELPAYAEQLHLTSLARCSLAEASTRSFEEYFRRDKAFLLMVMDSSAQVAGQHVVGRPIEAFLLSDLGTKIETFID